MRRSIEFLACLLFVFLMSLFADPTPGSPGRYEEGFMFHFHGALLVLFAAVMSLMKQDTLFRVVLYPLALFFGYVTLGLGVHYAYGYEWDTFWKALPYGAKTAAAAAAFLLLLNLVVGWAKAALRRTTCNRAPKAGPGSRT